MAAKNPGVRSISRGHALFSLVLFLGVILTPSSALAMHISEGILPAGWALFWFLAAAPFVALGVRQINRRKQLDPMYIPLLGIFGAAVFVFSCFPIPVPVAGSTAHPAGTGLSAIFLGPFASVVVAFISLLLQALFLAHGGLTTLGGNTFSMGVVGSFGAFGAFLLARRLGLPLFWCGFAAGAAADLLTYLSTSLELALALHGDQALWLVLGQIYLAFMPTQIPLAILEGAVTGGILVYVRNNRPDILRRVGVLKEAKS
ncbi:energy-coupling factor ABC transporter permease [Geoalkalibacter halelectricus]|uniref:Cobalt transport protein CbiM n=1 Tax=Geoalkalibacter halelectricus TaxID=2847045 RepID=A0ABY5ZST1_9BACT|nr:energy-coupling factor ABC transporter permease [Geoalkalibacter halelectricus]MDO3377522.1 energy-coupling factor ABC transporter permease [Geoalkalibacter halelectricus]UWZ80719.1 energy-coupling factor ABC transporter permease [Geoalkalibacter halelectricus]